MATSIVKCRLVGPSPHFQNPNSQTLSIICSGHYSLKRRRRRRLRPGEVVAVRGSFSQFSIELLFLNCQPGLSQIKVFKILDEMIQRFWDWIEELMAILGVYSITWAACRRWRRFGPWRRQELSSFFPRPPLHLTKDLRDRIGKMRQQSILHNKSLLSKGSLYVTICCYP